MPKISSSTLNKMKQTSIPQHKLPRMKSKPMNPSSINQYASLIFIGRPRIATKMNMYILSRLLNTGTVPTITNKDKILIASIIHD